MLVTVDMSREILRVETGIEHYNWIPLKAISEHHPSYLLVNGVGFCIYPSREQYA